MREQLNSNPVVQISVIGVLVVIVGLFFMMNMKKKSDSAATSTTATTAAATAGAVPGATTPDASGAAAGAAAAPALPSAPPTTGTVTPEALVPGPGLPKDFINAWKGGDAVALLIVRGGGIDDRLVRQSVRSLSGDTGVSVFVARAGNVARYSRITQGVGVDRAPALVVVRPRKESGSVPQAQVSYGFRDSNGVVQAVHDALYGGPDDLPYSPR
jgi:hypothetical protein